MKTATDRVPVLQLTGTADIHMKISATGQLRSDGRIRVAVWFAAVDESSRVWWRPDDLEVLLSFHTADRAADVVECRRSRRASHIADRVDRWNSSVWTYQSLRRSSTVEVDRLTPGDTAYVEYAIPMPKRARQGAVRVGALSVDAYLDDLPDGAADTLSASLDLYALEEEGELRLGFDQATYEVRVRSISEEPETEGVLVDNYIPVNIREIGIGCIHFPCLGDEFDFTDDVADATGA